MRVCCSHFYGGTIILQTWLDQYNWPTGKERAGSVEFSVVGRVAPGAWRGALALPIFLKIKTY